MAATAGNEPEPGGSGEELRVAAPVRSGSSPGAVDSLLADALARETESFDEPAFQANLERMLRKKASS